jgi:hypothetical protein
MSYPVTHSDAFGRRALLHVFDGELYEYREFGNERKGQVLICPGHLTPTAAMVNSDVSAISIMYVRCVRVLGHIYSSLTCDYLLSGTE